MKYTGAFKIIVCVLMIFCTVFSFNSCGEKKKSNIDEIFSELVKNTEETTEKTEETSFSEHIYVIIPNDCSGELSLKARALADGMAEKTGLLTSVKYDNELTSIPKDSCEVLIGDTNRLVSKNAMDVLKNDEYLYRWDDGAIVICGRSDEATVAAIDKFISDILPTATKDALMSKDAHFEFKVEYEVKGVTFNGYDLYDYVLVYEESNKCGEKDIALAIRDAINSKSGYLLDVISSKEVNSKTGKVISVCGNSKENALISLENGISLVGKNSYLLSLAAAKFITDFNGAIKDNVINLKYDVKSCIDDVDTCFEATFCFTKENTDLPFEPIYNLIALLKSDRIGICFIGNPDDALREDLALNVKAPIKTQEVKIGERSVMIAYDEEKVKQINISLDANGSYFSTEVEIACGEKISYIYIIDGEIPQINGNTVLFHEKHGKIEDGKLNAVANGTEKLSVGDIEYLLACEKNLCVKNSDKVVKNDENGLYITVNTEINYSNTFLDYTLK